MWHTKRQATVESAVFGAEFIAKRQGMEASRGLWYKLCMMDVPIIGPMYTYSANMCSNSCKILQNQNSEGGGPCAVLNMTPTPTNMGPSTTTKGDIVQMPP